MQFSFALYLGIRLKIVINIEMQYGIERIKECYEEMRITQSCRPRKTIFSRNL